MAGPGPNSQIKICLTGGPSAGKTTVIDLIRHQFSDQAITVPEAASILYKGGFPREDSIEGRKAAQRAIYHTQVELEYLLELKRGPRLVFLDRGTLDHPAYWPGTPEDFFKSVGTRIETEIARYNYVIHLQTVDRGSAYERTPETIRNESLVEALALDQRILDSWKAHPRRMVIPSRLSFHEKIAAVFEAIESCLRESEEIFHPFRKSASRLSFMEEAEFIRAPQSWDSPHEKKKPISPDQSLELGTKENESAGISRN